VLKGIFSYGISPASVRCKPIMTQPFAGLEFGFYGLNFVQLVPIFVFWGIKSHFYTYAGLNGLMA
jgi:hypothetical protein